MAIDWADLRAVESFLRERLQQPLPGAEAHGRFAPRPARPLPHAFPHGARPAAALLLLYPGDHGATFPLTVRHSELTHHPGQVSLPGGRVDRAESAEQAALREAQEEIGVAPDAVGLLGPLSSLSVAVSNHVIQPFVGIAATRPDFRLAAREVEAVVEMPLANLHDLTRIGWDRRTRDGVPIDVPFFSLHGYQVWGATAMILGEFGALFEADFGPQGNQAMGQ